MANISLTKENIKYIRDAFSHFFPEDVIYSADKPYQSGEFNWEKRNDFIDFVYKLTGISIKNEKDIGNIKKAELAVENLVSESEKEKGVESTVPEKGLREEQEAERVKRETEIKESTERAKIEVQTGIKRQQQLVEEIKNKQIYVKVQAEKVAQLSKEQQESVDALKNAANADPRKLIDQVTAEIEKKIASTNPQDTTPEEIHLLAKQTAYDTVKNLQGSSLAEDTVVAHAVAKGESVVARAVSDTEAAASLQTAATNTANQDVLRYTISRKWAASTFGKEFAAEVFGPESLDDLNVSFSPLPQAGFRNYDLSQIPQNYLGNLNDQNFFLGNLKDYGSGEIKSQFLQQASTQLETWIGGLPSDSFLAQTYNSELVQGALSYFGLGGSAVSWEGTTFFGQIAVDNGFGPILGWLGEKTGIDFGIAKLAGALGEEVVGSGLLGEAAGGLAAEGAVGVAAGEVATGAVVGAGGTGLASILGAAGGPIGIAVGAIVGWLASKIDWKKVGPILLGIGAFFIAGPIAGIVAGLGSYVLIAGVGGGMSAGAIGGGIVGFFGTLGGAVIVAVGVPILITLVVFPIVVALILFIINSGAYVVPPSESSLSSTNPYIDVQKTANPSGSVSSPTPITYTITVTAKKDNLTNIVFTNDCNGIKKGGNKTGCKSLENLPTPPASISPSSPYTFSFTSDYGPAYKDSLVTDSVTVAAKSDSGGDVSETGSASVCFGNCPLDCFDLSDSSWSNNSTGKANLTAAASTLASEYPNFAAKVCAAGTVKLCYTTSNPSPIGAGGMCSQAIFARHIHESNCDINFNQCGIKSQSDALYMLTHESTHHIQAINGSYQQKFDEQVPQSEWALCTYSSTQGNDAESMAEGDALFVGKPSWNGCITNYISQYPKHYLFAKNAMFAP